MSVRLTHRAAGDLVNRTFQALGSAFNLTGIAATFSKTWRMVVPDKIPYLMGMQNVNHTVGTTASVWTNTRTGTTYATLQAANNAAATLSGDTLTAPAGATFTGATGIGKNLTIRSATVGQKVIIDGQHALGGSGSIFNISPGITCTFQDLDIRNNKNNGGHNPGITTNGSTGTVTLTRVKISECNNGFLSGDGDSTGVVVMTDCEFVNNGVSDGLTHDIYVGKVTSLTMRGCYVHNNKSSADYISEFGAGNGWRASIGHLVKSRAKTTTIEGNRLTMEVTGNRPLDIPCGGALTVRGNLIEYRTDSNQGIGQAIAWGVEGANRIPGTTFEADRTFSINVQQNTIVARSATVTSSANRDCIWVGVGMISDGSWSNDAATPAPSTYSVRDNIFCGWDDNPPRVIEGTSASTSTTYAISNTLNTCGALSLLTDATTYNYTPVTPVSGSQNWTVYNYSHPTSTTTRSDSYRGAVYTGWGSGVSTGSYNSSSYQWAPGVDASGRVNQVSWNLVPLNTWVQVVGTRLDSMQSAVTTALPGWQDYGNGINNGSGGSTWNGITAFTGMAWDTTAGSERGWIFGGGHAASSNDGIYKLDLRKMAWSVQRLPMDTQYWTTAYKASIPGGTATYYGPAADYYIANPSHSSPSPGVWTDEFYDPANPDANHSPRRPTARHSYGACVFVPTLGAAGKILMGSRRYWEYDLATDSWATPKFPFGNQVAYGQFGVDTAGYVGDNGQGWWNATEQRYYVCATQGATGEAWSVGLTSKSTPSASTLANGLYWNWEGGYPVGSYPAQYTAQEQLGTTLWTLLYHNNLPPYHTNLPKSLCQTNLTTRVKTFTNVNTSALSGTDEAGWDGQGMTYVPERGEFLFNYKPAGQPVRWGWLNPTTAVATPITSSITTGAYPSSVEITVENKVKYFSDIHALVWVNEASSDIRLIRFA
jgi:hypothetical protein